MLLCIVIIGGMGNLKGVILGGMCILFFDRVVLAQSTQLVRGFGALVGSQMLMRADLSLWRWFFFGLTLIVVMILRPEGLLPSAQRAAELHTEEESI
jgi:branched-chain amino acid transport system permease protein